MSNPGDCYYPHSTLFVNSMDDIEAELDDMTTAISYDPLEQPPLVTWDERVTKTNSHLLSFVAIPVDELQTTDL